MALSLRELSRCSTNEAYPVGTARESSVRDQAHEKPIPLIHLGYEISVEG